MIQNHSYRVECEEEALTIVVKKQKGGNEDEIAGGKFVSGSPDDL